MKNTLILILLVAAVASGAWCVVERNQLRSQAAQLAQAESRIASLENQMRERTEAIEKAALSEQKATILQQTLTETSAAAEKKSKHAEQLEQSLAEAKTNDMGSLMAGMLKDPKMREMIKSQQKMFMGPVIDKTYGQLFQDLKLNPEQTSALKELIEKKMSAASDAGMSMMDSNLDATQRADLAKKVKADADSYDAQIKQVLGDDNFQSFQSYEKSMPDRMTVGQFRDQLAGSGTPLTSAQEQQMIQAMTEERTGFKWTTDYNNRNPGADANFAEQFSEQHLNQFAQDKAQFDQQYLARAKQILTPEQFNAFTEFQTAQSQMQINTMKMASKMFAPKSP